MITIIKETAKPKGVHDARNRICNRFLYEVFGVGPGDSCHEITSKAVAPYGLLPRDIPDTLDLFMNYPHDYAAGHFRILELVSRPADYIELWTEMDCIVGMGNCPDDITLCSARRCKSVKTEIYEVEQKTVRT